MNYLVLNPSVFIFKEEKKILLYNSNNGEKIFYEEKEVLFLFEKQLHNLNVIEINNEQSKNLIISNLIYDIFDNNMGYLNTECTIPPFQISPMLNIQNEEGSGVELMDNSNNALINIREITLFLNGLFFDDGDKAILKQTLFNPSKETDYELDYLRTKQFILPILTSHSLFKVNLLGYNILNYKPLHDVINLFYDIKKEILLSCFFDIHNYTKLNNSLEIFSEFENCKFIICIKDLSEINYVLSHKKMPEDKSEFHCLVHNEEEYIISKKLEDAGYKVKYIPIFNGNNDTFFKENVFSDENDILSISPSQNELFNNMKLNSSFFGKLYILPNGNVYTN
jgi:pseudo-rSAM protein